MRKMMKKMTKAKIDILFFDPNALVRTESEKRVKGQLYIEKRPKGKFLCFKKGDRVYYLTLTKKMFKSLNRFVSGVKMERFYDLETDCMGEDIEEGDIIYIPKRNHQTTLPAVIPPKPKIMSPFITQIFKFVPRDQRGSV